MIDGRTEVRVGARGSRRGRWLAAMCAALAVAALVPAHAGAGAGDDDDDDAAELDPQDGEGGEVGEDGEDSQVDVAADVAADVADQASQIEGEVEARAAAQVLFDQGLVLFDRGEYAAACDKFVASLAIYEGMGTQGKLAECYERTGRTASAWALYRKVAVLAARQGDTLREQVALERAAALESKIAYVTIALADAAGLPGLVVRRNGDEVNPELFGSAVAVDPGVQRIVATAGGYRAWTREVELGDGDRLTITIPLLARERTNRGRIAGLVGVGLGVASVGVSAVFGVRAWSRNNESEDLEAMGSGVCAGQCAQLRDSALREATYANVFFFGGLAVGAGGFLLWRWARAQDEAADAKAAAAVQIVPVAAPAFTGVSVSGTF